MASRRSHSGKDNINDGNKDELLVKVSEKRQAKRTRSVDPVSEKQSDSPKIAKMGDQNNLSYPKNLVNANIKEVPKVSDQPSSSTVSKTRPRSKSGPGRSFTSFYGNKKPQDSKVTSPKANSSPKSAKPYTFYTKMFKQMPNVTITSSTPGPNIVPTGSLSTPGLNMVNGCYPRMAFPLSVKKQQLSNDYKPRSIRPVDPLKENPLDTSKIGNIGNQIGDVLQKVVNSLAPKEVKNASPKPSTSTSNDKTETRNQELQKEINNHDNEFSEDDQEVENSRTNLRIQYIALIEKTNDKLVSKEQELAFNDIRRDGLKKKLMNKQDNEKDVVEFLFNDDISELDQEKLEQEKQLVEKEQKVEEQKIILGMTNKKLADKKEEKRKETEEILKKHRDEKAELDNKLKKEQDQDKNAVDKLKEKNIKLGKDLKNLLPEENCSSKEKDSLEAARATLECPICMELMKPPTKIWMCSSNHIVCEPCKNKLKGKRCPTCRTATVTWRAHLAENFARTVFEDVKIQVTVTPDIPEWLFDSDDDIALESFVAPSLKKKPADKKALVEKKGNFGNIAAGGSKTKEGRRYFMDSDSD